MGETSAAASVGMLLLAKQDSHLNCTTGPEAAPAAEAEPAETAEPDYGGSVFDSPTEETSSAPKTEKKTSRVKKTTTEHTMKWKDKIVGKLGELFDSATES